MNQKRILIVDDETNITELLKLNLEKTGLYTVRTANRGNEALGAAREFKPDLVLLDVMMPGMDGGDVAAQLQSEPAFKSMPIVFMTAVVKKEEVDGHAGVIGGFPYIAKPLDVEGVLRIIEENLH